MVTTNERIREVPSNMNSVLLDIGRDSRLIITIEINFPSNNPIPILINGSQTILGSHEISAFSGRKMYKLINIKNIDRIIITTEMGLFIFIMMSISI